jgi:hypothetical protein
MQAPLQRRQRRQLQKLLKRLRMTPQRKQVGAISLVVSVDPLPRQRPLSSMPL